MKQRVISSLVGLVLLFTVMYFIDTIVINIAIALVTVIAVWEMLTALSLIKYRLLSTLGLIFSATIPFVNVVGFNVVYFALFAIFVYSMFLILLKSHKDIRYEQLTMVYATITLLPMAFSSIVFLRDTHSSKAIVYIFLIFAMGWGADTGAYFAGRFFGKRKLAPFISPKKTVEGVYGGIAGSLFFAVAVCLVYKAGMWMLGETINFNWFVIILVSIVGCLVGVTGDLVFSVIKRQYGIKDYGKIMPGHGGVLDRFDSVCFIAPFFYLISRIISVVL